MKCNSEESATAKKCNSEDMLQSAIFNRGLTSMIAYRNVKCNSEEVFQGVNTHSIQLRSSVHNSLHPGGCFFGKHFVIFRYRMVVGQRGCV
jgi:hypothetical protein